MFNKYSSLLFELFLFFRQGRWLLGRVWKLCCNLMNFLCFLLFISNLKFLCCAFFCLIFGFACTSIFILNVSRNYKKFWILVLLHTFLCLGFFCYFFFSCVWCLAVRIFCTNSFVFLVVWLMH